MQYYSLIYNSLIFRNLRQIIFVLIFKGQIYAVEQQYMYLFSKVFSQTVALVCDNHSCHNMTKHILYIKMKCIIYTIYSRYYIYILYILNIYYRTRIADYFKRTKLPDRKNIFIGIQFLLIPKSLKLSHAYFQILTNFATTAYSMIFKIQNPRVQPL